MDGFRDHTRRVPDGIVDAEREDKYEKPKEMHRQALALWKSVLGKEHHLYGRT